LKLECVPESVEKATQVKAFKKDHTTFNNEKFALHEPSWVKNMTAAGATQILYRGMA